MMYMCNVSAHLLTADTEDRVAQNAAEDGESGSSSIDELEGFAMEALLRQSISAEKWYRGGSLELFLLYHESSLF